MILFPELPILIFVEKRKDALYLQSLRAGRVYGRKSVWEEEQMELKANILRIEHLSLSDGKGMRTVVFFKGCPLRCAWCSTPESQAGKREVYYMKERCTGCGACIRLCPRQALSRAEKTGELVRDKARCTSCFHCVDVCNYRAHQIYGKEMTVKEVVHEILKDEMFFFYSGGGVTFSGGDVFCQTDFAEVLIKACHDACINTAAELDMFTSFENVKRIVPHLQMFYADVKCMDPKRHKKWTGQDNALILDNIRRADAICQPSSIHIRLPLVAGINDDEENIRKTAEFCRELKNCRELEFLPYHRLGVHTYRQLGRKYQLEDHKSMSRQDVYQKMSFLCQDQWPYDLTISGLQV